MVLHWSLLLASSLLLAHWPQDPGETGSLHTGAAVPAGTEGVRQADFLGLPSTTSLGQDRIHTCVLSRHGGRWADLGVLKARGICGPDLPGSSLPVTPSEDLLGA
jgi:hypothetical protein